MKNLPAIVINGLKKALAWYTSNRKSADVKNVQNFHRPESKAVTVNDNSSLDIKLRQAATGIKALMDEQKVYKNPHLALRELSNGLNMPSYIVTRALNEVLGVNFYDLVNRYRVEEAKQLLTNPNMIALQSFALRLMLGLTPRQHSTLCSGSLQA